MIMSNISIVTAFFDIGRGEWTPDKGLPHYLQRTTDTYIERFSHLTKLENELVVFSTPDIIEKLQPLREGKEEQIKFVAFDLKMMDNVKQRISDVQKNEEYQKKIHPSQVKNPEYWNADYVLVNFLKSFFVNVAIHNNLISNDLVAWLDFGYCRTADKVPSSGKWSYDFDTTKMHLFSYHDYQEGRDIQDIIATNDVHVLGAKIVGGKEVWPKFQELMFSSLELLLQNNLVDDDQTLMLISYLSSPELFELHKIPDHQLGHDPFVIFKDFNNEA